MSRSINVEVLTERVSEFLAMCGQVGFRTQNSEYVMTGTPSSFTMRKVSKNGGAIQPGRHIHGDEYGIAPEADGLKLVVYKGGQHLLTTTTILALVVPLGYR